MVSFFPAKFNQMLRHTSDFKALGRRPILADWGGGVSAGCTAGRWCRQ